MSQCLLPSRRCLLLDGVSTRRWRPRLSHRHPHAIAATHHANPRASTVRERRGGVAGVASTAWHLHAIEQHSDM
jgi:hypothetical protein